MPLQKQLNSAHSALDRQHSTLYSINQMHNITVKLPDGTITDCPAGTTVGTLLKSPKNKAGFHYIAARVNNDVASLSYPLSVNSHIEFLTISHPDGWRVYRNSLCFLLAKAVNDLYPKANFAVEHSFNIGLYCSFQDTKNSENGITKDQLSEIEARMHDMVKKDFPIARRKLSYEDAVNNFEASGQTHKLNLLKYRNPPRVVTHWCDGFSDLAHGPLAPGTGVLTQFQLIPYPPGCVLHLPERSDPITIAPFKDQPHLFQIFQEHKEWGRLQEVSTVGRLNEIIATGKFSGFIAAAEALHEEKITKIAQEIAKEKKDTRLIMIAGPSCAGKTTFAKRLSTHLVVNGLKPLTISVDDYFVGEKDNPVDDNGKPDYEHIEAVDIDLFNKDLLKLINGEEIELPSFNFKSKKREYQGDMMQMNDEQVLIIEGIHCLNPRLTNAIPDKHKFGIFISALTQLNLDTNNRISTTDNRLMRRLIRDHNFRGHSALDTLRLWPNVREGEKKWIFPYQRHANATFNSALDYELAVLKPLIEPLLMQIKPMQQEYATSRRLTEFLLNFLGATAKPVPSDSILREYIDGSSFEY